MKKGFFAFYPLVSVLMLLSEFITHGQFLPVLQIANSSNGIALSWPQTNISFYVQTATNLNASNNWIYAGLATDFAGNSAGGIMMSEVPATNTQQFFRLWQSPFPSSFPHVPIFQFAVFYNLDLEINPSALMVINGRVHSNSNIWATGSSSSAPLEFSGSVDAVGTITKSSSPLDPKNSSRSGNVVFAITNNNPIQHFANLSFPTNLIITNNNPTNWLTILANPSTQYSPPNYAAMYSEAGSAYLKNDVDLIIANATNGTNGTGGTNIIVYYQNPNNLPNYISQVSPDTLVASNVVHSGSSTITNLFYDYSFVTNVAFFDNRELKTVQCVQINVAKLNSWLTNISATEGSQYNSLNLSGATSKGHGINSIYVFNAVPLSTTQMPAVRLVNGQQLPASGLTIITPDPIYVEGNYNITTNGTNFSLSLGDTTNTYPAALIGDAITILSSNWSDSSPSSFSENTTINAALLQGIVPSNGTNYSGGLENSLRLLENWSLTSLTYNGSFAVMFQSQYATNFWLPPANYYTAPARSWGFDKNFTNTSRLPPLTPAIMNW